MTPVLLPVAGRGMALKKLAVFIVGAGAIALLAALLFTLSGGEGQPPSPEPAAATEEPPPAPEPRVITGPYAQSPYAAAIEDGLNFAAEHHQHHRREWQVYVTLDYLYRKFGLDEKYAIANTCPTEAIEEADRGPAHLLGRLVNPAHRVDQAQIDAAGDPITQTMARAVYCDLVPVDEAFVNETLAVIGQQPPPGNRFAGYVKTHFILSLELFSENGCAAPFPQIAAARGSFADTLYAIVEQEDAKTDLAFEAMAFLFYLGFRDRVSEGWISQVAALQLPGGGWAYDPEQAQDHHAHGHPTTLAIWVLLEHALPGVPHVPWLAARNTGESAENHVESAKSIDNPQGLL